MVYMPRRATEKGDLLARVVMKTAQSGVSGGVVQTQEVKGTPTPPSEVANIIEFVESSWGLGLPLYPVQRVILKAHYGIPLDDTEEFEVTDWRREKVQRFTEKTYLEYLFAMGRSNIKTVKAGEERRTMVLALGRRSGKCVLPSTWIFTDKGMIRIGEFEDGTDLEEEHFPLEVGVAQEGAKRSKSSHFYRGGCRNVIRIRTKCGYEIGGTPNHRIRVMGEDGLITWRRLDELEEGTFTGIHRNVDLWPDDEVALDRIRESTKDIGRKRTPLPSHLNERWALLLGLLVGDGSWTVRNSVDMTIEDKELWEIAASLFAELFGEIPSRHMDKRTSGTGSLRFHSHQVRAFLHFLGFDWSVDSHNKRIPWVILRSPKKVVSAFLRGLFETDGGVEKGGSVVSFCTASADLAEEVQLLLLNFGIVSNKSAKWNDTYRKYYYILKLVGSRSRRLFAEHIGFLTQRKGMPLKGGLTEDKDFKSYEDRIPHQKMNCLRSFREGCGSRKDFGNTIKPGCQEFLTYSRAKKIPGDHFQEVLDADYFYDPIVEIFEDVSLVYDLCVPDGESFVANGFTNHNTSISACIVAYEVYRLIHKSNPQKYYGLVQGNRINLVSLAVSKDQASLLFSEAAGHFAKCSFFKRYRANNTMSYLRFQSPWEIDTYGAYEDNPNGNATIKVAFAPCNANTIRGSGNIVAILDEVAHFVEKGNKSAEKVYTALAPSAAAFTPKGPGGKEPRDGKDTPSDARVIMISSPLGRSGLFYQKFRQGMEGGKASENMLCIQAPTWEVNPTVSAAVFHEAYATDPRQFYVEFGAEFSDRTMGFFEDAADVMACVDKSLRRKLIGVPNRRYFMGFDLGLVEDSSALAIVHIEEGRIVTDVVDELKAGAGKHRDKKRLEFDDVAEWIYEYSRFFSIQEGLFDQWSAIPLEQSLAKKGLVQIKSDHMTAQKNSEIYLNLKSMIFDRKLVMYDITEDERKKYIQSGETPPEHLPYIVQLLELQAVYKSKYVTDVGAPKGQGKHDDLADALARAVWLASLQMGNLAYMTSTRGGLHQAQSQRAQSYEDIAKARAYRRLGGTDIKRMAPKNRGLLNWYAKRYPSR